MYIHVYSYLAMYLIYMQDSYILYVRLHKFMIKLYMMK